MVSSILFIIIFPYLLSYLLSVLIIIVSSFLRGQSRFSSSYTCSDMYPNMKSTFYSSTWALEMLSILSRRRLLSFAFNRFLILTKTGGGEGGGLWIAPPISTIAKIQNSHFRLCSISFTNFILKCVIVQVVCVKISFDHHNHNHHHRRLRIPSVFSFAIKTT